MTQSLGQPIHFPGEKLTGDAYVAAKPHPTAEDEAEFQAGLAKIEEAERQAVVDAGGKDMVLGEVALSTTVEAAEMDRPRIPWHVVSARMQRQKAQSIQTGDRRRIYRLTHRSHTTSSVSFMPRSFVARQDFKYGIRAHLSS